MTRSHSKQPPFVSILFQHKQLPAVLYVIRHPRRFTATIGVPLLMCRADLGRSVYFWTFESFFCRTSTCKRKIFPERIPTLVQPSARMTKRLQEALQALGLATGGEGGSQLARKLGMQVAPTTLLQCVRTASSPSTKTVRVLGLDDWAYKRGQVYGTILVD